MTTQCTYCGEGVPPHSMFCGSCGQLVASRPVAVPPPLGGGPDSAATAPPVTRAVAPPPAVPLPPAIGGHGAAAPPPPVPPAFTPAVAPAPEAAPGRIVPAPTAPLSVRLPDGALVPVTGPLVLGRKPTPDIAPQGFTAVTVEDPRRSMSRAHITLEPDDGHLLLSDLGGANGTTVEHDGTRSRVNPTSGRVAVSVGDRIWLGLVAIDIV